MARRVRPVRRRNASKHGFTLIELLVVLVIIGILVSLVAPRFVSQVDRAKEAVLRQQLTTVRDAIDRFYGLHQRYPANLQDLVDARLIRNVPVDPLLERDDAWVLTTDPRGKGVFDLHSSADGTGSDGKPYASW